MVLPEWSDPDRRAAALDWVARDIRAYNPRRTTPTRSELQVLTCLSHGMTRAMAADALGLGVETVKSHLRSARQRLGAKDSTHAVAIAIRLGMIR